MKKYLALLLFATVVAAEVLVEDGCEVGETYWCSSVRRAKQCGAFDHCLDAVWPHKVLEKDSEDVCQFCESIIKDVRAFVDSNKDEVQQFMESACAVIPVQQLADQCKQVVEQDLPEVFALIDSELDPQTCCAAIGLCSGFSDMYKAPTSPVKAVKAVPICKDCKAFFGDIKAMITDATTEKELEDMIDQELCSQLGSMADTCKALVQQYAPLVFEMLASEVDPDMICQTFGFCNSTALGKTLIARMRLHQSPLYKAAKVSGDGECTFCKSIMTEVQGLYRNKATQEEIEAAIKQNLCMNLGALKDECDQTVDQYMPELFQILVNELDPDMMCTSLGFCSKAQKTLDLGAILRATSAVKPVIMKQKPVKDNTGCAICKVVVNQVDQMLENNATEAEIEAALKKVCNILPDTLKESCDDFINTYGELVISLLEKELDPEAVCEELKLCTPPAKKRVRSDTQCVLCEFVIKEVLSLLEGNSTKQDIEEALDKVCSLLPSNLAADCTNFVDTYTPTIILLLEQELDPQTVCSMLGLCTSNLNKVKNMKVKDAELCGVCETVLQYMDSIIELNSTDAQIEAALDKVCNFLPKAIQGECTQMVAQYGPELIQLIAQYIDPKEICQKIGLCPNNVEEKVIVPEKAPLLGANECTYGPAYWCASKENAQKCKAVKHCENHVWNQRKIQPKITA